MEIFKKPFVQVTVPPFKKQNSQNTINAEKLLNLIKDEEFKKAIITHYSLSSLDFYINIGNIDTAYKYVEYVSNKYEYINNLWSSNDKVKASFLASEENDSKAELYFDFDSLHDKEDGVTYNDIKAKVEYDSSSQFYNDRELSKYINYLKSKNNRSLSSIRDRNILIEDVNNSWKRQYERNPNSNLERKFKFLKDKKGNYFLKSITSKRYKEYGVSFCFVIAMLSLHKAMQKYKGLNLDISSLALNESKIDIIVSSGQTEFIEDIGQFMSSSILINNNDLGNKSLSFTHSLKLTPFQNDENKIFLFPKVKEKDLKYKISTSHTSDVFDVLKVFDNLSDVIHSNEAYINDFKMITATNNPDELRQKIEEKILNSNAFKGVHKLKDLFKRSPVQHIDNLAKLLEICQRAEMIDMDYDLKFKLRYWISDILLYGKSN